MTVSCAYGKGRIVRKTYRINLRLDAERDGDIIAWLEGQPAGGRSEAIRVVLRQALEGHQERSTFMDPEDFRYIIADELDKALSGLCVQPPPPPHTTPANEEAEAKYGDKLDRMLDSLGKR